MLDGLTLAGGRPLGDGAADEENELLGGGPLEVAEMTHIGGVGQHHWIRRPRGGVATGAGASEDEQGGNLHWRRRIGGGNLSGLVGATRERELLPGTWGEKYALCFLSDFVGGVEEFGGFEIGRAHV